MVAGVLRGSVAARLRRRTPTALVPHLVRVRVARAQNNAADMDRARLQMRFLLEKTDPEADLDAAAIRYIERTMWRAELRWHPQLITCQEVEGLHHLTSRRGGMILSFMHHGEYDGALASLGRLGAPATTMAHPRHYSKTAPAFTRQRMRLAHMFGGTTFSSSGGRPAAMKLLADGALVGMASDVASRTPVVFAKRNLLGASGAARIAMDAKVPVGVMTSHDRGGGAPFLRIDRPLLPRDFDSVEQLLAEMIRRHETAVLDWPEAVDQPARRWTILGPDAANYPPPL